MLPPDSSPTELRAAIDGVLADKAIRTRTEQLAATMRRYRRAEGAVDALERLVDATVA